MWPAHFLSDCGVVAVLQDFFVVSLLAMGGAYFTNQALNYLNYTTRIVFKSSRVIPVMLFR